MTKQSDTAITTDEQMLGYEIINAWLVMGIRHPQSQTELFELVSAGAQIINGMSCDADLSWAYGVIKEMAGEEVLFHIARMQRQLMDKASRLFHGTEATRAAA